MSEKKLRRRVEELESDLKHLRSWVKAHHEIICRLDGELKTTTVDLRNDLATRTEHERLETLVSTLDDRIAKLERKDACANDVATDKIWTAINGLLKRIQKLEAGA